MSAIDIITKALVVIAGIALIYFGFLNVVIPLVIAIPPRYRNVPDGPDQHVRPSMLVMATGGALAFVLGGALLSLVFEGGGWIENLASGIQGLGALGIWIATTAGVAAIMVLAHKVIQVDFSSRYWLFGIALFTAALEAYLIYRYVTQRDPLDLISALIFGIALVLRWALLFVEMRRP